MKTLRLTVTAALAWAALLVTAGAAAAQPPASATLRLQVLAAPDSAPVDGARIRTGAHVRLTDADGRAALVLPPGSHRVTVSRIGFAPDTLRFALEAGQDTAVMVRLAAQDTELESVVVAATRAERRVEDTPLRVEVVDEEEVAEKAAMTPGDIAMMLNETSGLRVQTTSPSLGGAGVRIHGLRGRYTLLLADGLPLFGQAGGVGLLQIPPVDLARAEIIKGTASALYGAAALGGVVNLVSRRPADSAQRELLLNQTSRAGSDVVLFGSAPLDDAGEWGATMLASAHRQRIADLDDDGWADLPGYDRAVLRPRLFHQGDGRSLFVTAGFTAENREGGTVSGRTAPDGMPYAEGLRTRRADVGAVGRVTLARRDVVTFRASAMQQRHAHRFGPTREADVHRSGFTELTGAFPRGRWTWVAGAALQQEQYANADVPAFDFTHRVPAVFAQADVDVRRWLVVSGSARYDRHNVYGGALNPRLSVLVRGDEEGPLGAWTARVSGGAGTYAPVPFTEETDATGLVPVRPLRDLIAERVVSGSADVTLPLATPLGALEMGGALFASRLSHAVAVREDPSAPDGAPAIVLVNAPIAARTWGGELLARLVRGPARVTATYAHLRATEWDPGPDRMTRRATPLVPRHTAGVVASMEAEDAGRLALEVYYTGRQALEDNPYRARSEPYVIVGMLGERVVALGAGKARLFLNLENIGNVRQTRYDPLLLPTRGPGGRWTTDAWTELSGFTLNGGVRLAFCAGAPARRRAYWPKRRRSVARRARGSPGVRKRSSCPPAPWFTLKVPNAWYVRASALVSAALTSQGPRSWPTRSVRRTKPPSGGSSLASSPRSHRRPTYCASAPRVSAGRTPMVPPAAAV